MTFYILRYTSKVTNKKISPQTISVYLLWESKNILEISNLGKGKKSKNRKTIRGKRLLESKPQLEVF